MNKSRILHSQSLWFACLLLLPVIGTTEIFRLTAAGPQSANLPFIGVISTFVVPESNKRLQEMGSEHSIIWREA